MFIASLKPGVNLDALTARMSYGALVIASVFAQRGIPFVVTSGCDGTHKNGSKHYVGDALDIRLPSRYSTSSDIDAKVVADIKAALNAPALFDVVLEADHIHVEYDRKGSP